MTSQPPSSDQASLERFANAQCNKVYETALGEIQRGRKTSHWMWYIFPQAAGLGSSETARFYALRSPREARAYLAHPVLGPRLRECSQSLLEIDGRSAFQIFGSPDDMKLKSCLTLFADVADGDPLFERVLEKYFGHDRCNRSRQFAANDSLE